MLLTTNFCSIYYALYFCQNTQCLDFVHDLIKGVKWFYFAGFVAESQGDQLIFQKLYSTFENDVNRNPGFSDFKMGWMSFWKSLFVILWSFENLDS